jgi:anthranilate synthase/aminodeoxychorismate synthase-like glutamine amidotransferase
VLLLIDNYDSFTWNLAHRFGELGTPATVVRNDVMTLSEIEALRPTRIVISPGPGRPESAGVSIDVLKRFAGRVPLLGVCLGHQAMGVAFGGRVIRADAPMHGKVSQVAHDGKLLFAGLASPLEAGRYHSLVIDPAAMPADFVKTAWVEYENTIMGIRHVTQPTFGLQFHPESVLTPTGHRILQNFLEAR